MTVWHQQFYMCPDQHLSFRHIFNTRPHVHTQALRVRLIEDSKQKGKHARAHNTDVDMAIQEMVFNLQPLIVPVRLMKFLNGARKADLSIYGDGGVRIVE